MDWGLTYYRPVPHTRDMTNTDAWLEKPYQDRYSREDAYVEWCEENDLDPTGDHWDAYDEALADMADDYASERAEAAAEEAYFDRY